MSTGNTWGVFPSAQKILINAGAELGGMEPRDPLDERARKLGELVERVARHGFERGPPESQLGVERLLEDRHQSWHLGNP